MYGYTGDLSREILERTVYYEGTSSSFAEYLRRYGSDEITSPRGLEPLIFIREIEFWCDIAECAEYYDGYTFDGYEVVSGGDLNDDGEQLVILRGYTLYQWNGNVSIPLYGAGIYPTEEDAELERYENWRNKVYQSDTVPPFSFDKTLHN
jgi:hypothetical protein